MASSSCWLCRCRWITRRRAYVRVKAHFFKQYYINSEFSVYLSFTGIKDFIVNSFKSKAVDFSGQKLFG
ncbi:hypothetical protein DIPPA_30294 [Diplonema papillatum]|nr:hypothetical protein DIPPA_30294 [Diplonema papillatum]